MYLSHDATGINMKGARLSFEHTIHRTFHNHVA